MSPNALFQEVECPEPVEGLFFVYITQSIDGALYIGQSVNIKERLRKHKYRIGAKFTKDHPDHRLVYYEKLNTREDAVHRETQLKKWTRAKKNALIAHDIHTLKKLASGK